MTSRPDIPDQRDQIALVAQCSDLVQLLDTIYPEQAPNADDSDRVVWMKAGQRDLVRRLLYQLAESERGHYRRR